MGLPGAWRRVEGVAAMAGAGQHGAGTARELQYYRAPPDAPGLPELPGYTAGYIYRLLQGIR